MLIKHTLNLKYVNVFLIIFRQISYDSLSSNTINLNHCYKLLIDWLFGLLVKLNKNLIDTRFYFKLNNSFFASSIDKYRLSNVN
jgi:hypothetical protein